MLYGLCQSTKGNSSGSAGEETLSCLQAAGVSEQYAELVQKNQYEEIVGDEGKTGHTSKVNKLLGGQQGPYQKN